VCVYFIDKKRLNSLHLHFVCLINQKTIMTQCNLQLFPLLRTWGATGLLLEWEDTFPYNRELSPIGSNGPSTLASGYTVQEARHILQIAGDCGLAVVPLVQTFGHMEV